jgi:hypothetical protein
MTPTLCNRCGDAVPEGCDPKDELSELDALLERLRLKRYDLKRKINRFHSPIIRQLPPDVILTIFEFCLPHFAICSYWRDIGWSESTPSLWSSMVLRVLRKNASYSHMATGIAKEWLAHSGHLHLSIRISARSYMKTVSTVADIIN